VSKLNNLVQSLYEEQCVKAKINKQIVKQIKEQGQKYRNKLDHEKNKILTIISDQKLKIKDILKFLDKTEYHLNLLIHMEQASLIIHTDEKKDDLSDMIDVQKMPIEMFREELEQMHMLKSSFDILKVELEKQKEYINKFSLSDTAEEHYFYESEKLESKLSEEEIVSIAQLRDFCNDLHKMIRKRLDTTMPFISESDRVAIQMIEELNRIKVRPGLFSLSFYRFMKIFTSKIVRSHKQRKLIIFLIFFLISRLKKLDSSAYLRLIRTVVLCYNLLRHMHIAKTQRFIISGALVMTEMRALEELRGDSEEIKVIKGYYKTVHQLFIEEFAFVNSLIASFNGENSNVAIPWVQDGARIMKLVHDFDAKITDHEISAKDLLAKHHNCDRELQYLLAHYKKLLPRGMV